MIRRAIHHAWLAARQRDVLGILQDLERSERLPRQALMDLQWARLRSILAHAAAKVPFYVEYFRQAGIDPAALQGPDAIRSLPVVTKAMLRADGASFMASDASRRGATANHTGGSTGQPLVFQQDDDYRLHRQAAMYRGFRWCGWRPGGPLAYLWGSDVDSRSHRGLGAMRDALFGITWIDAFTLEESAIDRVLHTIERARADILIGYASSLQHLARRALASGRLARLKSVETSAELLTPEARREIEQAFSCRVLDRYGCREAGVISHECGAGEGWHVNVETTFVETDAEGRLLLTTLMNYSMPLIRYRNEDLVELGDRSCSCGRTLPLMTRVMGRRADIIRSPAGRAIHGEFFTHLFYGAPGVVEFQVVQKSLEDLVVRVVAGEAFTAAQKERIESTIRQHGDARFRIRWENVREIPRGPSGKFRFTISELDERGSVTARS